MSVDEWRRGKTGRIGMMQLIVGSHPAWSLSLLISRMAWLHLWTLNRVLCDGKLLQLLWISRDEDFVCLAHEDNSEWGICF